MEEIGGALAEEVQIQGRSLLARQPQQPEIVLCQRLPPGSLAFTFCQTPTIYHRGESAQIEAIGENGQSQTIPGLRLDEETTRHLLNRDGTITKIVVTCPIQGNF